MLPYTPWPLAALTDVRPALTLPRVGGGEAEALGHGGRGHAESKGRKEEEEGMLPVLHPNGNSESMSEVMMNAEEEWVQQNT